MIKHSLLRRQHILTQFTVFKLCKREVKVNRNQQRKRRYFTNNKSLRYDAKRENYARIYDVAEGGLTTVFVVRISSGNIYKWS